MADPLSRPMHLSDVDACVAIHMQAFPGFFLTFLGPSFIRELYRAIVADPSGISFVVELDGQIAGFVIGTDNPSGLYTRLLRRRLWSFGWASLNSFIKKPDILPRLLRAFTMPDQKIPIRSCGTLMSIAVKPAMQGKKVGQRLVKAFLQESTHRGLNYVNLTTDCVNNEYANRFYQGAGFSLLRQYQTPEGRQMNEYAIALQAQPAPERLAGAAVEGRISPAYTEV